MAISWINTASQERGVDPGTERQLPPAGLSSSSLRHPTDIYPLPGAGLITGQAYTMPHLGWGDDINFYERSEQKWTPLQTGISDFLTKHNTIPVETGNYFPNPTNMLAQPDNLTAAQWNEFLGNHRVSAVTDKAKFKRGSASIGKSLGLPDDLLLTKQGMLAGKQNVESVDVHEYLHILDGAAGFGNKRMSSIMYSYINEEEPEGGWTEQALYEKWMNDPNTAHLDMEDPSDRSPHKGRNNPREGFGKYLARAFTDPRYHEFNDNKPDKLTPQEMFARAGANSIRPYGQDEGFTPGLFGDLDRVFANSLATFLNN